LSASPVTDYTPYLNTARRRARAQQRAVTERRQRAWDLARQAARLLRERYAAQRVVAFGSLVHEGRFTAHSDVDLAVWGIPWPDYLHALGEMLDLDSRIEINLVDVASCHPALRTVIEREGVEL
jgi:predicted nucleotidyltransferase